MKPACQYGLQCLRQNSEHWLKFSHSESSEPFHGGGSELKNAHLPVETKNQSLLIQSNAQSSANSGTRNLLLMLVGLPGSGKSTFCNRLLQSHGSRWKRICQDTISNGNRGSKEQCLKFAEKAFSQGFNVMIDRCNLTKEQRAEFLKLARRCQAQAEALVLDLPVKTCIQRAMQRTGHEGGLEGKGAPAAIQRMAQRKELPGESEGFFSIHTCHTGMDVEKALGMYEKHDCMYDHDKGLSKLVQQDNESTHDKYVDRYIDDGVWTLAFPSISTADFKFDHETAAEIIVNTASDALHTFKDKNIRFVLVDLKEDSDMLARVRRKAAEKGLKQESLLAISGDITKLRSGCGLQCNVISNATNWRLKAGGGGVNAAIFQAAGQELDIETKKRANTITPGSALAVPLPRTSPLFLAEGITHVIHVLGPNMNPQRPNCLQGDYIEGCRVLREAYACMFRAFASIVDSEVNKFTGQSSGSSSVVTTDATKAKPRDAFAVLMQSAKRKSAYTNSDDRKMKAYRQDTDKEEAVSSGDLGLMKTVSVDHDMNMEITEASGLHCETHLRAGGASPPSSSKLKKWEPWAEVLRKMALHPEQHKDVILQVTEQAIVIMDKFPKAKKHLLVVSRKDGLDGIDDLRSLDLSLLQCLHNVGRTLVKSFLDEDPSLVFRIGYHSDPSMRQLHMHVISQDFDSPSLKNKKHWNSFTTPFFRDSKAVLDELMETGRARAVGDEGSLLKLELRCHRCRSVQPNIPRLKQHIGSCKVSFPDELVQKEYLMTANQERKSSDM